MNIPISITEEYYSAMAHFADLHKRSVKVLAEELTAAIGADDSQWRDTILYIADKIGIVEEIINYYKEIEE